MNFKHVLQESKHSASTPVNMNYREIINFILNDSKENSFCRLLYKYAIKVIDFEGKIRKYQWKMGKWIWISWFQIKLGAYFGIQFV
jgi:hypothetical protein